MLANPALLPPSGWSARPKGFTDAAMAASPYLRAIQAAVGKEGISFDMHMANFAYRGHQLVMLDPLYSDKRNGPIREYDEEGHQRRKMQERRAVVARMPDAFDPWFNEAAVVRDMRKMDMLAMQMAAIQKFEPIPCWPSDEAFKPLGLDRLPKPARREELNRLNLVNHNIVRK